jgi:hypothetical protein
MGLAFWAVSGALAFLLARLLPAGRSPRWPVELAATLLGALALGAGATALDFGGWQEPDLRAAAFCFFGALAGVGAMRAWRLR